MESKITHIYYTLFDNALNCIIEVFIINVHILYLGLKNTSKSN